MQKKYPKLFGALCLLVCAMIWGSAFVAQIFGASHLGPMSYNALRFLMGSAVLAPFVYRKRKKSAPQAKESGRKLRAALLCGTALFLGSYFQQRGMADTTAGKAGFISALYIVLVPVVRMFGGKKAALSAWLGVLIALIGMYLLCIPAGGDLALGQGDAMVLVSAFFFSLHIIAIDRFVADTDPVELSCMQFLCTGLLSLAGALLFEETHLSDMLACKWAILYAGLMSCGVAYTLQTVGQKTAQPLQATLILSLEGVFSAISGALVLGESFSGREFAGCALIFAAVLWGQCSDMVVSMMKRKNEGRFSL